MCAQFHVDWDVQTKCACERAHTLIHPDIFVRWRAFWFERTSCFSRKSTQVFVHEAPEVFRYHGVANTCMLTEVMIKNMRKNMTDGNFVAADYVSLWA